MDPVTNPVGTCSSVFVPPHTIIGGSDIAKTAFEGFNTDMRELTQRAASNARAWDQIAQDAARRSLDFYSLVSFNAAVAGQTGETSNQQTVSPVRTGAADNLAAAAVPSNRITDTAGAVAGAGVDAAIPASIDQRLSAMEALIAQLVQNSKQTPASAV